MFIDGPVGRWHQHPELESLLVLLRRGAVGVEQVALVENGVGDLPGLVEVGRIDTVAGFHDSSWPARASRASTVASQVGSALRLLNWPSSSSVFRLMVIQAVSGK